MYKATILVVEDDAILALLLEENLTRMGYRVAGLLATGEAAIDYLSATPVDLVLMDIELAGPMNGIVAAERIHALSNTPVVFLTGYSQDPLVEQAKIAAPYGYLIKPVPERELSTTIEMALNRAVLDKELRQSRQALAESEARYRHLFENAPLGIFRSTLEGRLLMANDAMAGLLGCRTREEAQATITDMGQQLYADPGLRRSFIAKLLQIGRVTGFEFPATRMDGKAIWLSMAAKLTRTDEVDGDPSGPVIDGFMVDITERKYIEGLQEFLAQTSATLRDESFFHALARYLAETLMLDFVCIDRLDGDGLTAHTLAVWSDGHFEDNMSYTLKDTPCAEVVGRDVCGYPAGVCTLFPDDTLLQELRAESYIGTTLWNHSGKPIGLIALISRKAYTDQSLAEKILSMTAPRAAGELEQLLTEKALLQSEERFDLAMQAAQHGLYDWHLDSNEIYYSPAWKEMLGYQDDELENSFATWEQLIDPQNINHCWTMLREHLEGKRDRFDMEFRMRHKDGHWVDILSRAQAHCDGSGKPVRVVGTHVDMSDRRRAERNYETLFREMLNGFALHEIIVDEIGRPVDYRFLAVNPAFERMTGLNGSDIVGRTVFEIMPETERSWIEMYGGVALTGQPVFFENYSGAIDKHFEVAAFSPASNQFACIFSDITPRKKAEEEKRLLELQLQHAQKMEAIGTLAGGIAHDFNNILGSILGYAELAKEDCRPGSSVSNDLDQVIQASERARDLVKQILAFSRQQKSEYVAVRPETIITEVGRLLQSSFPSTITIEQSLQPVVGMIFVDPGQMHQILMNLCTNALHAMEEKGGCLTISLTEEEIGGSGKGHPVELSSGRYAVIKVKDTGPGIPAEIMASIFDPYFTTKEVGKGTGMGLAIVHGLVRGYGGTVAVESTVGQGAIFTVYIPVVAGQEHLLSAKEEPIPTGDERIMLIDDEVLLTEINKARLERLGYRVKAFHGSLEALDWFNIHHDEIDLVITDQTMPDLTGMELAGKMLAVRPGLPIILCTGFSTQVNSDLLKEAGITGFAMKPVGKRELGEMVREQLDAYVKKGNLP